MVLCNSKGDFHVQLQGFHLLTYLYINKETFLYKLVINLVYNIVSSTAGSNGVSMLQARVLMTCPLLTLLSAHTLCQLVLSIAH